MEPRELTAARIRLGLTQAQLAEHFGVHPMTVNKWENHHHRIPEMVRLALIGFEVERQRRPAQRSGGEQGAGTGE
jgi:DNA-binding XRE family transcriptional regulator